MRCAQARTRSTGAGVATSRGDRHGRRGAVIILNRVAFLLLLATTAGCSSKSAEGSPDASGTMPDATANDSSTDSQAEPDGSADAGTDSEGADARGDASYTVCPPGITPSFRTILAQMLSTSG